MSLTKMTRTLSKQEALAQRKWVLVDAEGKVLGRVAAKVASLLRGKHKPNLSPNLDCGDFVVVVNASKIRLTGNKADKKIYYRHSGYPGSIRAIPAGRLLAQHPERVLRIAVEGMLPKNRLGRKLARKLKIYAGPEHPHSAQQPEKIAI